MRGSGDHDHAKAASCKMGVCPRSLRHVDAIGRRGAVERRPTVGHVTRKRQPHIGSRLSDARSRRPVRGTGDAAPDAGAFSEPRALRRHRAGRRRGRRREVLVPHARALAFATAIFGIGTCWTLNAEVGFKAPLGAFEPFIGLGGGYARLGRLNDAAVRVQGYNVRLNAGADYYFNKHFSVGGIASAEVLGMTRPGVDLNQATGSVARRRLQARRVECRCRPHGVRRRRVAFAIKGRILP